MIADIEKKYHDYVCDIWREMENTTKDCLEPHQEPEQTYNIVSSALIQFLQDALKGMETQDN